MMSEEFTQEQQIERGRRAAALLSDPLVEEVFTRAKEEFVAEWLSTNVADEQMLSWAKVHALDAVIVQIRRVQADGEYAAEALRRAQ